MLRHAEAWPWLHPRDFAWMCGSKFGKFQPFNHIQPTTKVQPLKYTQIIQINHPTIYGNGRNKTGCWLGIFAATHIQFQLRVFRQDRTFRKNVWVMLTSILYSFTFFKYLFIVYMDADYNMYHYIYCILFSSIIGDAETPLVTSSSTLRCSCGTFRVPATQAQAVSS